MDTLAAALVAASIIAAPPTEFARDFDGMLIEFVISHDHLRSACQLKNPALAKGLLGCSWRIRPNLCIIYLRGGLDERRHAAVRRHEIAHCNGWPADHRGAT